MNSNRYYYFLNIGLSRNDGQENTVETTLACVGRHCQPREVFHKLAVGEWEGKPEYTLVLRVETVGVPPESELKARLEALAVDLGQDAIAYAIPSAFHGLVGKLYGANPNGRAFDKSLFNTL